MACDASLPSIPSLIDQITASADDPASSFLSDDAREAGRTFADELLALDSIYAGESLRVVAIDGSSGRWEPSSKVRLELQLPLDVKEPPSLRLSLSIPSSYPASSSPPQLQLLDRFLGPYEVDTKLFSDVLRTFRTSKDEAWGEGDPARAVLFEGCEAVKARVEEWLKEAEKRDAERKAQDGRAGAGEEVTQSQEHDVAPIEVQLQRRRAPESPYAQSARAKQWTTTDAVVERKSTFVGHAVRLDHVEEVPYLLEALLDKYPRIDKATHPLMRAWVCAEKRGGATIMHRDNDDDGETAAGGRLAHLLDTLVSEWAAVCETGSQLTTAPNAALRERPRRRHEVVRRDPSRRRSIQGGCEAAA